MIVKLMCAVRGNDDHPRHGHRIFEGVREVEFLEPSHGAPAGAQSKVVLFFHGDEVGHIHILDGNAYVMTDSGKTFSRFEVIAPLDTAKLFEGVKRA